MLEPISPGPRIGISCDEKHMRLWAQQLRQLEAGSVDWLGEYSSQAGRGERSASRLA